jgi:hypothetical protein
MNPVGWAFLGMLILFDLLLFYACFKQEDDDGKRK